MADLTAPYEQAQPQLGKMAMLKKPLPVFIGAQHYSCCPFLYCLAYFNSPR